MKPQPASSPVARALSALRRWARDAWLARLCIVDRVRGLFGRRKPCAAWDKSGKPAKVGLALEFLERRETPDDVFGLLHAPMLGTGLALLGGQMLTPATVLVDGWSAGRTPTPSPHATATDGWRAPGLADAPPNPTPPSLGAHPTPAAGGGSGGSAGPADPTSSGAPASKLPDDPFADPLGGDWLDAVDKALGAETPPAAHAPSAGGPSAGAASAAAPAGPVTAPAVASPSAAPTAADPGTAFQAGQPAAASSVVAASSAAVNAAAASTPPAPGGPGGVNTGGGQGAASPQASAVLQAYGRTPLAFEPNYGQTSSQALFLSQGPGFDAFLTDAGAVLSLPVPAQAGAAAGRDVLTLSFAGADPAPQVYATGQLPGVSNYFAGNDPSQWIADVPNYAGVVYHDLYPGVDLQFSGDSQNELEYSFTVAPGADPSQIRTSWQGAQSVTTDAQGDLLLTTASGQTLTETAPALYQTVNGVERPVAGQAVVNADGTVGFRPAGYDPTLPLVIDPRIVYSSYLGGSGADYAYAVAADASGAAYVAGVTASTDFPTASGYQNSNAGGTDAFVTKLNAQGDGLVYSTYLGGASNDEDYGVAVDLSGRAWVVGTTSPGIGGGSAFPTTPNAVERTVPTGGAAFAARLSAAGDQLTYSTLLGDGSTATAVAVDALGDAYLTGSAAYNALFGDFFPTTSGAFQTSPGGGTDAFLAKLAPTPPGSAYSVTLAYSSYLGGSSSDEGQGVAVDGSGDAYVTGYTQSGNFPTTCGRLPDLEARRHAGVVRGQGQPVRLGPGLRHLPGGRVRRRRLRDRRGPPGRRLRHRRHLLLVLPDHRGRLPDLAGRRRRRHGLRGQAQARRLRPDVRQLPGRRRRDRNGDRRRYVRPGDRGGLDHRQQLPGDVQRHPVHQRRRHRRLGGPGQRGRHDAQLRDLPGRLGDRRGDGRGRRCAGRRLPGGLHRLHELPDRPRGLPDRPQGRLGLRRLHQQDRPGSRPAGLHRGQPGHGVVLHRPGDRHRQRDDHRNGGGRRHGDAVRRKAWASSTR